MGMRSGDSVRHLAAVAASPARHQPFGGIQRRRVEAGKLLATLSCHLAQHRIDQACVTGCPAVGACEMHGEIDRSMVGHIEKQDLRGAEQQRGFDPRRICGQPALQEPPKQVSEAAQPAQHVTPTSARTSARSRSASGANPG